MFKFCSLIKREATPFFYSLKKHFYIKSKNAEKIHNKEKGNTVQIH